MQTYSFIIISDEKKYLTTFRGNIPPTGIRNILKDLHSRLYEDSGSAIILHLNQYLYDYTDYHFETSRIDHTKIMALAENLLHSDTPDQIDNAIVGTDNCFLMLDHQKWLNDVTCEGCYFAVRRISSGPNNKAAYNIIGQTFTENKCDVDIKGYFAIRSNRNSTQLYDILVDKRQIVPSFGCVDLIRLLQNIDHIKTAELARHFTI